MTITISISELRNNISAYLTKASSGTNIIIRDDKRSKYIAQITGINEFNKKEYEQALSSYAGSLSEKHKEWRTKASLNKWIRSTRKQSDRTI